MHDRRIDGKAHTFGNQGALYMRAMTWFDHETESIWSQPIGTALLGEYEGVRLEMIPAEVVPWKTWREQYPETLILERGGNPFFQSRNVNPFTGSRGAYVVGVSLGDVAKAYPFETVADDVVVNDAIGDIPVFVYANPVDRSLVKTASPIRPPKAMQILASICFLLTEYWSCSGRDIVMPRACPRVIDPCLRAIATISRPACR